MAPRSLTAVHILAMAALSLIASEHARANTLYTYTAHDFVFVRDFPHLTGTYTTSMHLTIGVEFAQPLAPNVAFDFRADLRAWSVSDGRFSWDSAADGNYFYFPAQTAHFQNALLVTDEAGMIASWNIVFWDATETGGNSVYTNFPTQQPTALFPTYDWVAAAANSAPESEVDEAFTDGPGQWTARQVVPLPSALPLLCLGCVGLAYLRRRSHVTRTRP